MKTQWLKRVAQLVDPAAPSRIRRAGERHAARIVLVCTAGVLTLVWLTIAVSLIRVRQSTLNTEQLVAERMTTVVEEQTRHFFSLVQFFLSGTERALLATPHLDPRDNPEFLRLIEGLRERTGSDLGVRLVTAEGDVYDVSGRERPRTNIGDRDSFLTQTNPATRGMHIGAPVISRITQRPGIPVSHPLPYNDAGFTVLVVTIPIQALNNLYEQSRPRPRGSIALVGRDGTVMARAPDAASFIGRSIAGGEIWTRQLPRAPRGSAVIDRTAIDSTPRVTGYAAMYDLPLVVIVSSSTADILRGWRRMAAAALAVGLTLSLTAMYGARRLMGLFATLAASRAEAEEMAWQDPLTGLPNRRMIHIRIDEEIARAKREDASVAVMFLDLDGFKDVNDTFGHDAGDALLRECARRIKGCIRDSDVLARLGGDEFTVALYGAQGDWGAERVAAAILDRLAEPFALGGDAAYVSASIGISVFPADGGDAGELMRTADQAMYAAKREGKSTWRYFTRAMQRSSRVRMALLGELRRAVTARQFVLHYQPIVDLRAGGVRKAEALLRWNHPERGIVEPAEFIGVMEDSGLIVEAGDWVFREAARQVAEWRCQLHPHFQISVNKSAAQFRREEGGTEWSAQLASLRLPGSAIAVEITESMLLEPTAPVRRILMDLYGAGIQVALDDFGTGYSSLAYLRKFDIDYVKIDRAFVSGIADAEGAALCRAIIAMAHSLGLKVVAEGIEEEYQRRTLVALGCDYGQGYLFSRPVPAEELPAVINRLAAPARTDAAPV